MENQTARLRRGSYRLFLHATNEHAFGVDDDCAFPFPIPFSVWAGSAERYWVTLTKRRRVP